MVSSRGRVRLRWQCPKGKRVSFHLFPLPTGIRASIDGWQKVGWCGRAKHACLLFLFTTAAAVAAGALLSRAAPSKSHVAASALLSSSAPTRPTLASQVTKESESLDTDFSLSSDGSLGPASRRRKSLQNVLDLSCRPSSALHYQQQQQQQH